MALLAVNWKPDARALRGFGLIGGVFFLLIGLYAYFESSLLFIELSGDAARTAALVLWCVSGVSGVLAVTLPRLLYPLYVLMLCLALPIGFVVSHVIMALVYYGMFTPIALVFRLIGRDALDRKLDPTAKSYWVSRPRMVDPKRYFRQF